MLMININHCCYSYILFNSIKVAKVIAYAHSIHGERNPFGLEIKRRQCTHKNSFALKNISVVRYDQFLLLFAMKTKISCITFVIFDKFHILVYLFYNL